MKNLLFIAIVFFLFSCDTPDMEKQEPVEIDSPLIGTWVGGYENIQIIDNPINTWTLDFDKYGNLTFTPNFGLVIVNYAKYEDHGNYIKITNANPFDIFNNDRWDYEINDNVLIAIPFWVIHFATNNPVHFEKQIKSYKN